MDSLVYMEKVRHGESICLTACLSYLFRNRCWISGASNRLFLYFSVVWICILYNLVRIFSLIMTPIFGGQRHIFASV